MNTGIRRIAVVGAGPRGLSVVERICANVVAAETGSVAVHVVDPYPPGAGQVWRTGQSAHLLMNTVASQVTVFCDETVTMAGPVGPGPSLYEWARFLVLMAPLDSYSDQVLAEAQRLGPDDYPTRAFYGHYLEWAFRHVVDRARRFVDVRVHRARAVDVDDAVAAGEGGDGGDGRQELRLDSGEVIGDLDAVVMALGHQPVQLPDDQRAHLEFAASSGLVYLAPANPADVELSAVEAGDPVAILGLGLTFFDYLTLLTTGRGGTFAREDGRLRYLPSGSEPEIYAGSRRGVPYHARGENQKGAWGRHVPAILTEDRIRELRTRSATEGGLDFREDIWPLVAKEVETEYYTVLLRARHCDCVASDFRQRYLELAWGSAGEGELLDSFEVDAGARWSWERLDQPYQGRSFTDTDDFNAWLLDHLHADVAAARQGNVAGPAKAALDVLRDLRNEVRLLVDHGGLSGESYRRDLERWYTPFNAFLSIGPPVRRIEEMAALIEAGVLRLLGPQTSVTADPEAGRFVMESAAVPGSRVLCTAFIEARIPEPDLIRTRDRLLMTLVSTGGGGAYRIPERQGTEYRTRGLAVTQSPYHLLNASGTPHPRRFAFGIPTEAVHWATAAGARPGVNSVTLGDADAIARAALRAGSDSDHHDAR